MKTLDETIDNIETCQKYSTCISCPYCGFNECKSKWGRDALHYLKEYQRYQNTPSRNGHMALVNYFEELQKNEPLTLDELKWKAYLKERE